MFKKRFWFAPSVPLLVSTSHAVNNPDTLYFGAYFEPSSIDPHAITEWAALEAT